MFKFLVRIQRGKKLIRLPVVTSTIERAIEMAIATEQCESREILSVRRLK